MKIQPLCLWCEHFYLETGSPGYSDLTPGSDFYMDCSKGHWEYDQYSSTEQYRKCILTALRCKDYQLNPAIVKEIEAAR